MQIIPLSVSTHPWQPTGASIAHSLLVPEAPCDDSNYDASPLLTETPEKEKFQWLIFMADKKCIDYGGDCVEKYCFVVEHLLYQIMLFHSACVEVLIERNQRHCIWSDCCIFKKKDKNSVFKIQPSPLLARWWKEEGELKSEV